MTGRRSADSALCSERPALAAEARGSSSARIPASIRTAARRGAVGVLTIRTALKRNQAPLPGKVAALLRESRLFVLVAGALYLSLVLTTFNRADPGWSHSVAAGEIRNLGGRVGAWLADMLLYLFGLSAWWWVVFLVVTATWTLRRLEGSSIGDRRSSFIALAGFCVLLAGSSGVEALRLHSLKVALPLAPGGLVGDVVARVLQSGFGFTGATLILLTLCAMTLSLFTGISWLAVMEKLGGGLESAYLWSQEKWQGWQDRKAGAIAAEKREAAVGEKRELLIDEHAPIRIEPPVVEIPKSARVQRERQEPLFRELPDTPLPPIKLLDDAASDIEVLSAETLEYTSRLIEKKLADFGVQVKVLAAYPGPVITRYEVEPAVGVKGSQVVNLVKDLARALSVYSIRVVETIPGKSCMGLEIPNPHRQIVRLSEIISSRAYHELHAPLTLALGKDIAGYNHKVADGEKSGNPLKGPDTLDSAEPQALEKLPYIVVIIDELADLIMVSGRKVEELIARLAQKARAGGVHLILATQRPSVDVITGLIKANIPTRIAFQVSSKVDSRTILDQQGAESLIGQGDMLYLPPGSGMSQRVHGAYVADQEVHKVVAVSTVH